MTRFFIALLFSITLSFYSYAQDAVIDNTEVINLSTNQKVPFNSIIKKGEVTLLIFWASWARPTLKEIHSIHNKYETWSKSCDFNIVLINLDVATKVGTAKKYLDSKGYDHPSYIDMTSELKKSLKFELIPYTLIIDKDQKIYHKEIGYGGEKTDEVIFEKLKEACNK